MVTKKKAKEERRSVDDIKDRVDIEGLGYAIEGFYGRYVNSEDEELNKLWEKAYDALDNLKKHLNMDN